MGKGSLWKIVAFSIAILNVLQLCEAECDRKPPKNCANNGECDDPVRACFALKAGEQKMCLPCQCREKSQCGPPSKPKIIGMNFKCTCPPGFTGDHCECEKENNEIPFFFGCQGFSSEYFTTNLISFSRDAGNFIEELNRPDLQGCMTACTSNPACFILEYYDASGSCAMFSFIRNSFKYFLNNHSLVVLAIRKCK